MSFDYLISFEGLRIAGRNLSDAARKIASINKTEKTKDEQSESGDVDLAAALLEADRAKIAAKANLKILDAERELNHKTLDIFV
jgi:hypothetical protein